MSKLSVYEDNKILIISVEDQSWTEDALQELRDKYNIFFMTGGDGVQPILLLKNEYEYNGEVRQNSLFVIGSEDDGTIQFHKYNMANFDNAASTNWIDSLIADLTATKKFAEENFDKLKTTTRRGGLTLE